VATIKVPTLVYGKVLKRKGLVLTITVSGTVTLIVV